MPTNQGWQIFPQKLMYIQFEVHLILKTIEELGTSPVFFVLINLVIVIINNVTFFFQHISFGICCPILAGKHQGPEP